MLKKINHVIVRVGNVEKAIRFWTEKVGLKVKERDGEWIEFEIEGTTLALLEGAGRQNQGIRGSTSGSKMSAASIMN